MRERCYLVGEQDAHVEDLGDCFEFRGYLGEIDGPFMQS